MSERLDPVFKVNPPAGPAFARYFNTLRYLKPKQLVHLLRNRLNLVPRPKYAAEDAGIREGLSCKAFAPVKSRADCKNEISFLNKTRKLDSRRLDWRCAEETMLWRYNLHYFDYLHWDSCTDETKGRLIDSWIQSNPINTAVAWEPYPVSLRIVNWIKYFLSVSGEQEIPADWVNSLSGQAKWLESKLEHHLLANHLLKNAKALVFSGIYFSGESGSRQFKCGFDLMLEQGSEQILPDGGHIERSPMYHCIVLEDYLDVLNLLTSNPEVSEQEKLVGLRDAAVRAMDFLKGIVLPDGNIPLFNDAAFDIAVDPLELLSYGAGILDLPADENAPEECCIQMPDSGYYGYKKGGDGLIIDCGLIGPDYQPGHGHCDLLSYELCLDGRRIVVDSGAYDYESGPLRQYLRSTAAHNTVRIDGLEQSEIWGTFRVARRARPINAELSELAAGIMEFKGAHDGYCRLPGRPVHQRTARVGTKGQLTVTDEVTGAGTHLVESFIHIHPDFELNLVGDNLFEIHDETRMMAMLRIETDCEVKTVTGRYCPEFGKQIENTVLVLAMQGRLPMSLTYSLEKA